MQRALQNIRMLFIVCYGLFCVVVVYRFSFSVIEEDCVKIGNVAACTVTSSNAISCVA